MNGYDAQDMATQGAEGFRNGYQAGYADAVKAYEAGKPAAAQETAASRESEMVVIRRGEDGRPAVWCDPEIADLVSALNVTGIASVASCSGHGHRPGTIALADGRELLVMPNREAARKIDHLWPGINGEMPAAAQEAVALRTAMQSLEQIASAPDDQGAKFNAMGALRFLHTQPVELHAAPEGFVLVPVEPTREMMDAGRAAVMAEHCAGPKWTPRQHYKASGLPTTGIPEDVLDERGPLTKESTAVMVYGTMLAARPQGVK